MINNFLHGSNHIQNTLRQQVKINLLANSAKKKLFFNIKDQINMINNSSLTLSRLCERPPIKDVSSMVDGKPSTSMVDGRPSTIGGND